MSTSSTDEVSGLLKDVEWAFAQDLGPTDLIPMLEKLIDRAPLQSFASRFGRQCLSELVVESDPWRAASLSRALAEETEDDRAWAVLGLSHTLMGHYRCAARAYTRAVALSPGCASYNHNLGHLLDVAMDRPLAALTHLRRAHRAAPDEPEIAASYAHALLRSGQLESAQSTLEQALGRPKAAQMLEGWTARAAELPPTRDAI